MAENLQRDGSPLRLDLSTTTGTQMWYSTCVPSESQVEIDELVAELVRLRKVAEISVSEVARRMRTSLMSLRRIERGDVVPSVEVAARYASAVGVHLTCQLEDLEDSLSDAVRVDARVDVDWGLEESMRGTVVGVHGSPARVWLQVKLDDGPTVDVPAGSVQPRRTRTRQRS